MKRQVEASLVREKGVPRSVDGKRGDDQSVAGGDG